MRRRSSTWVALVAIGLAGVVAVSAATALAARSAASPFELVLTGRYEPWPECQVDPSNLLCFDMQPAIGTFTSNAPFCESGTTEELRLVVPRSMGRRYTCADGSGSLTLSISNLVAEFTPNGSGEWTIVEGSGRYEDIRGKGTYTGELLGGNPADLGRPIAFRTTARGFADADATPPSIAITSASATKLRSPLKVPAYRVRVAFSIRDDVEGNPVAYRLKVTQGRVGIASEEGTTTSGSVSVSLRVEPFRKGVRSVGLQIRASDPIGNVQSLSRGLTLPRR